MTQYVGAGPLTLRRLPAGRFLAVVAYAVSIGAGGLPESRADAAIATGPASKVSIRPMSELKITATIPIGTVTDWVAVTPLGVWVGSKKPNACPAIPAPDSRRMRKASGCPCVVG
jgi:hypothetical protein